MAWGTRMTGYTRNSRGMPILARNGRKDYQEWQRSQEWPSRIGRGSRNGRNDPVSNSRGSHESIHLPFLAPLFLPSSAFLALCHSGIVCHSWCLSFLPFRGSTASLRPLPFLAPPAIPRIPLPLLKTSSFFCFFENVGKMHCILGLVALFCIFGYVDRREKNKWH